MFSLLKHKKIVIKKNYHVPVKTKLLGEQFLKFCNVMGVSSLIKCWCAEAGIQNGC
jgi:hypothetical protein